MRIITIVRKNLTTFFISDSSIFSHFNNLSNPLFDVPNIKELKWKRRRKKLNPHKLFVCLLLRLELLGGVALLFVFDMLTKLASHLVSFHMPMIFSIPVNPLWFPAELEATFNVLLLHQLINHSVSQPPHL